MKSTHDLILGLIALCLSSVKGQTTAECYFQIKSADKNGDDALDRNEFVTAAKLLGAVRNVFIVNFNDLPGVMKGTFTELSCRCSRNEQSQKGKLCCVDERAVIDIRRTISLQNSSDDQNKNFLDTCDVVKKAAVSTKLTRKENPEPGLTPMGTKQQAGTLVSTSLLPQCFASIAVVETSRPSDDLMDKAEYAAFVNQLSGKAFDHAFSSLPQVLQDNFDTLARRSEQFSTLGVRSEQNAPESQHYFLGQVCFDTTAAIDVALGLYPTASPKLQATTLRPTRTLSQCFVGMLTSDSPRNNQMDQEEYVSFINFLEPGAFEDKTFSDLSKRLQENFKRLADGGAIKLGEIFNPGEEQREYLEQVCEETNTAITADLQSQILPSQTPSQTLSQTSTPVPNNFPPSLPTTVKDELFTPSQIPNETLPNMISKKPSLRPVSSTPSFSLSPAPSVIARDAQSDNGDSYTSLLAGFLLISGLTFLFSTMILISFLKKKSCKSERYQTVKPEPRDSISGDEGLIEEGDSQSDHMYDFDDPSVEEQLEVCTEAGKLASPSYESAFNESGSEELTYDESESEESRYKEFETQTRKDISAYNVIPASNIALQPVIESDSVSLESENGWEDTETISTFEGSKSNKSLAAVSERSKMLSQSKKNIVAIDEQENIPYKSVDSGDKGLQFMKGSNFDLEDSITQDNVETSNIDQDWDLSKNAGPRASTADVVAKKNDPILIESEYANYYPSEMFSELKFEYSQSSSNPSRLRLGLGSTSDSQLDDSLNESEKGKIESSLQFMNKSAVHRPISVYYNGDNTQPVRNEILGLPSEIKVEKNGNAIKHLSDKSSTNSRTDIEWRGINAEKEILSIDTAQKNRLTEENGDEEGRLKNSAYKIDDRYVSEHVVIVGDRGKDIEHNEKVKEEQIYDVEENSRSQNSANSYSSSDSDSYSSSSSYTDSDSCSSESDSFRHYDSRSETYTKGYITTGDTTTEGLSTIAETPIERQRFQEIRDEVGALVRTVVPKEADRIDAMMTQFKGREEELLQTLRTMQERGATARARAAVHKSKACPPLRSSGRTGYSRDGAYSMDSRKKSESATRWDYDVGSVVASARRANGTASTQSSLILEYEIQPKSEETTSAKRGANSIGNQREVYPENIRIIEKNTSDGRNERSYTTYTSGSYISDALANESESSNNKRSQDESHDQNTSSDFSRRSNLAESKPPKHCSEEHSQMTEDRHQLLSVGHYRF